MNDCMHEVTGSNEKSDARRLVEVIGRRCKKCKIVVESELREFR